MLVWFWNQEISSGGPLEPEISFSNALGVEFNDYGFNMELLRDKYQYLKLMESSKHQGIS